MSLTAPAVVMFAVRIVGAAAKTLPSPMPTGNTVPPVLFVAVSAEVIVPLLLISNCGLVKEPPSA